MSAPARRDMVRFMVSRGLSERRALLVIRMSASALRYQSAPDRNEALRERIVALARRHLSESHWVALVLPTRSGQWTLCLTVRQMGV